MTSSNALNLNQYLDKKNQLVSAGQLRWFHWVIIIASLLATLSAWSITRNNSQQQMKSLYEREASQLVARITERMSHYEDALWGGVATLTAFENPLSENNWRTYSETLNLGEKYPGINGMGIIDAVQRPDISEYLALRRTERHNFMVFPEHNESELWPIVHIEPLESNMAALGLDIAHESNRLKAARAARNTGKAQITGPITLVQDARKTPGFLFYAPHYTKGTWTTQTERQENFINLVYAPFVFERLMEGTLDMEGRLVSIRITDEGKTLYDEISANGSTSDKNPKLQTNTTIDMYGRQWTFNIQTNKGFNLATQNNKPLLVLISGLAIEALIIALFTALTRANRRAVKFADDMASAFRVNSNLLTNILNNATDGILLSDQISGVQSYNKACETLFGYTADEILGEQFGVLFPDLKADFCRFNPEALADETTIETLNAYLIGQTREVTGQRKNGEKVTMEISISEIHDSDKLIYNTIVRDISKRKQAEKALKRSIEDLVQSNEDLERFAYVASHDLKSPLRAIDNLCLWLQEDAGPQMDAENKERLYLMRGRIDRMDGLLNSLLSYSRANEKFIETKRVNASQLLKEIISLQNIPIGFDVIVDDSLDAIMIRRMPLEQVFHNLLSNAVKHHNKTEGRIEFSASENNSSFQFYIKDDGPGIDPMFHNKIFEMFQTLRTRDEVEGSGMGLALVKKMLRRYNGHIEISSNTGEGTCFTVTWPKTSDIET